MKFYLGTIAGLATVLVWPSNSVEAADNLASAFDEGSVKGGLRAFYNHRDFDTKENTSAFATGGFLSATTAAVHGVSATATFYSSHDMGTRSDDPLRDNANLPENIDILAEAYLQYAIDAAQLRLGRQIINTPFANASDAFMIPVAYEAVSVSRTTDALTLHGLYLDRIKGRPDGEFVDVSDFAAARYGVGNTPNAGTWIAGIQYQTGPASLQGWAYQFSDLFQLYYLQADVTTGNIADIGTRIAGQLVHQQDDGDSLLGDVDTQLAGLKLSATWSGTQLSAAWNQVEESTAFNAGRLLAPFNFSTSPVFTNSMLQTLENSTPGHAWKLQLQSELGKQLSMQLSYADYTRIEGVDASEVDIDLTWRFARALEGLSFRLRVGIVEADTDAGNVVEVRPQLQYLF